MFHAQLKLNMASNGRFIRYENFSYQSLEALNRAADVRMREIRKLGLVVSNVRYWEDDFPERIRRNIF